MLNSSRNVKLLFLTCVLWSVTSWTSGLQCYSCLYERIVRLGNESGSGSVFKGDANCRKFIPGEDPKISLKSCNNETEAINYAETEELKTLQATLYEPDPLIFRMACITMSVAKVTPQSEIDVVFRGCYAKRVIVKLSYDDVELEEEGMTTTTTPRPPLPPVHCAVPQKSVWELVRSGGLDNSPINENSPTLKACVCDTGDGCNLAPRFGGQQIVIFTALVTTSVFRYLHTSYVH